VSGGPPVRVDVSADPPALLGPGPRAWALTATSGEVEVTASGEGAGVLIVAVEAAVADGDLAVVRRSRTRYDLTIRSRVSLG
jgi:hypothetical protein